MNWERYLEIKRSKELPKTGFLPENQVESKQALALGVIDIGQYVEFSLTTEPLLDKIHDPDPDVRKEAIRSIAERRTPFAIQMLHNLLVDNDEEVRLYAASELDRLEGEMQRNIHKLRNELHANPNISKSQFDLAKTYIEYAQLLLKSENLQTFFLNKAISLLNNVIIGQPQNADFRFQRSIGYFLTGHYQKALSDLKKTIKLNRYYTEAFVMLAKIYFILGNFKYVKNIMNVAPIQKQNKEEYYAYLFWQV